MEDNIYGYVYCLIDPFDQEIKYIGKTIRLEQRKLSHMHTSACRLKGNKELSEWITYLKTKGFQPKFEILMTCRTMAEYLKYEGVFVNKYYPKGKLFNKILYGADTLKFDFVLLKKVLKEKNVIYKQVAQATGINNSTISAWMSGKPNIIGNKKAKIIEQYILAL